MFAFLANMQAAKYDDVTVDGVKYRAITDSTGRCIHCKRAASYHHCALCENQRKNI